MSASRATPEPVLSAEDRAELEARGIPEAEALRQLALLAAPPPRVRLLRPCRAGDGIRQIDPADHPRLRALSDAAAREGRLSKFVPASGAATRMFQCLLAALDHAGGSELSLAEIEHQALSGNREAAEALTFQLSLERFPFYPQLAAAVEAAGLDPAALRAAGAVRPWLEVLLLPAGLGYADLPKGLIPFHRYPSADGPAEARTALGEHLAEAAQTLVDEQGCARLHFTIAAQHRARFEEEVRRCAASPWAAGVRFEVGLSYQEPATDTVALGSDGRPFRTPDGRLLFRPGGHGSLLPNLERSGGDLVFIRNIDNVLPSGSAALVGSWSKVLAGVLLELQARLFELHDELERARVPSPTLLAEAAAFAGEDLGHAPPLGLDALALKAFLLDRFERPLRVCGMVENRGEPGGGPFWVESSFGEVSLQIVEAAQIDPHSASQQDIVRASGYFNPVDLVCALRDRHGCPYPLADFADPTTAFVASKSQYGKPLKALEHPGLWNGGMARWNTVFVEVPAETFAPVKTVLDLLRPEHGG